MFEYVLILSCISSISFGIIVDVEYSIEELDDEYKEIKDTEVTSRLLGEFVKILEFKRYKNGEEQIDLIANLPNLERIYMVKVGQQIIPSFENLPRLKEIYVDKNDLVYLKKGAISETPVEVVNFNYNDIKFIEKHTFGLKVEILRLTCNKLVKFSSKWFKDTTKLIELQINANLLTTIQQDQFKHFPSLKYIDFSLNKIYTIAEGAFSNRRDFISILLQHNKLTDIQTNVFYKGNISVDSLTINNNKLTFLTEEFFGKVHVLKKLQLDDNPWQCKCWEDIKGMVDKDVLFVRDYGHPICVKDQKFDNKCTYVVAKELIECFEKHSKIPSFDKDVFCASFKNGL